MKCACIIVVAATLSFAVCGATVLGDVIVPLIQMDSVPLPEALRQVARQARLNVILDPKLSQPPYRDITITVRWENVTAREALTALLDNYGLALVESPRSRVN